MAAQVTVSVSGGNITAQPDPVSLRGQGNGVVSIKWDLDTPGWSFTGSGIDISNSNFQKDGPSNNNKSYSWKRKSGGADSSTVKYTINVVDSNNNNLSLDPTIINEP